MLYSLVIGGHITLLIIVTIFYYYIKQHSKEKGILPY